MVQTRDTKYRKYGFAAIKRCGYCECEYFRKIQYNKYKDEPSDISNGDREFNPDYRATLLECFRCGNLDLPQISMGFASGLDQEIANEINQELKLKHEYTSSKKQTTWF